MTKEELNREYGKTYFGGKTDIFGGKTDIGNAVNINRCKKVANTFEFLKKFGIEPIYADTDCICLKYGEIDRIIEQYEANLKEIEICHRYIDDRGNFDEHIADNRFILLSPSVFLPNFFR